MERGLIITLPDFDDGTHYLNYYSKEIISETKTKGLKIKEITDEFLDMSHFSLILRKLDYNFIVFNGHGEADAIYGYKDQLIIKVGENNIMLNERIVYARSCDAGSILGKEITRNSKEGCFIGYRLPFVFFMDQRWSTKPSNDNVARLFLEPSNIVPLSLIKGNTTKEAHINSKRAIIKNMKKVLKNEKEPGSQSILAGLWNNFHGQVLLGNENVRI